MAEHIASAGDRIRVLIADDQAHVRRGLRAVLELESDLEIVGIATNGLEALELAECLRPDVILMDLSMPHLDGLEATRRIREQKLGALIIAMTTHNDSTSQSKARQAGAAALIDKGALDVSVSQIIRSEYYA